LFSTIEAGARGFLGVWQFPLLEFFSFFEERMKLFLFSTYFISYGRGYAGRCKRIIPPSHWDGFPLISLSFYPVTFVIPFLPDASG